MDRGSQYCSNAYQALLSKHGFICSMSDKGNCYDNDVMEIFYHTLKVELVYGQRYRTRGEAETSVFDYIEIFYNREPRIQASIIRPQMPLSGRLKLGVQFFESRSSLGV